MNDILVNNVVILKHCMPSPRNSLLWNVIRPRSSQTWQRAYLQNKFLPYKITKYGCRSSSLAGQKHSSPYYLIWFSQNHILHTLIYEYKKWLKTQKNSFWDSKCFYNLNILVTTSINNPEVTLVFNSMSLSNASNIMAFSSGV